MREYNIYLTNRSKAQGGPTATSPATTSPAARDSHAAELVGPATAARGAARGAAGSALTDHTDSLPSRKRSRRSRYGEEDVNPDESRERDAATIEESESEPGRDTSAEAARALALAQNRARRLAMVVARDDVSSPRPMATRTVTPSPTPPHARPAAAATFSSTAGADPLVPTFTLPGQNGDARQQGSAAAYAPRASSESTRRLGERDVQRTVQSHFGVAQNQHPGGSEFQLEAATEPSAGRAGSRRRAGSSRRGKGSANPDDDMESDRE